MSNVLNILIEQASEKADHLAQQIGQTQVKLTQAQEKLTMLETYRNECEQNFHSPAGGGFYGHQLKNRTAFAGKINLALEQQSREIEFLQSTLTHQKNQWQDALAEQRKYEALIAREKQKLAKRQNQLEQKMNDEFAARAMRMRLTGETL